MKIWITFSDLCSRWDINQYDIAQIILDGKLLSFYAHDMSALHIIDGGSYVEYLDGQISKLRQKPLTIEELTGLVFRTSDVEEYESKEGITPRNTKLPSTKPITNAQKAIAIAEAEKLYRNKPSTNRVEAKEIINEILKKHKCFPYSRTQFNRITKHLNFPPAPRGRKSTK